METGPNRLKAYVQEKNACVSRDLDTGKTDQQMTDAKPPKPSKGGLNSEIQSRIGHQLRALYDDVVRQGVPDRFAELIRQLDSQEAATRVAEGSKKDGRD